MDSLKKIIIVLSAIFMLWSCSDDDKSENSVNSSISLSSTTIQKGKEGGTSTITVTSSDNWRLTGMSDWAKPSATSGKSGDVVTFTVNPNELNEARIALFKFFTGSSVVALQVESNPNYNMDLLSEENSSVSNDKSTFTIQLNTNVANPTITYNDDCDKWVTFNRSSDFDGKTILSFSVENNPFYKSRTGTISISSPLVSNVINVKLNQKQTDAILIEDNNKIVDLATHNISIKVKHNIEYKAFIKRGTEWITAQTTTPPEVGDDGLTTISLNYKITESTNNRGGNIEITDADENLIKSIPILQMDPNAKLVDFPDKNFKSLCISKNWIFEVSENKCLVFDEGKNATILEDYDTYIEGLNGIENFPNLTTLILNNCTYLKKLDISSLHKVTKLSVDSQSSCEEYNLGDNLISEFAFGYYDYVYVKDLKITGSKVPKINLNLYYYYGSYDSIESVDVSECPALSALNIVRGEKLKTLYLKTGQVILNLTKSDWTEIVYK